ncbi:MAG: hypothetical protein ABIF19_12770 [Planctomycetota bacterium]
MNMDKNNKKLDELICDAVTGNESQFDFDKWKEEHKEQVEIFQSQDDSASAMFESSTRKIMLWRKVGYLAAALLVVTSWVACFVLSGKVTDLKDELARARRNIALAPVDDSATINFYLEEHRDLVARHASLTQAAPQPAQMRVNQHDILYYEILEDEPEYVSPGIIVRGPTSQRQINSSETTTISNGHKLTLSEAKETTNFDLVAPPWLHPYYKLDQIRTIEDRDALQLLYTNGINSISLFEQPLNGQRGLEARDFREYAVYRQKEQAGGTILAWRDDKLSYVLIGNTEMSQLMDMAQSISASK